jgi:hypothetical protein
VELQAILGTGPARLVTPEAARDGPEEGAEIHQIEVVVEQRADGDQQRGDARLRLAKEREVHGHLADREVLLDGAPHDPRVPEVEEGHPDRVEHGARDAALHGHGPQIHLDLLAQAAVALEKRGTERVGAQLGGGVLAGEEVLEVGLLSKGRGAAALLLPGLSREAQLGHERGQRRQEHDRRRPEGELGEQDHARGDDHEGARQGEVRHHQLVGAGGRVFARPHQALVGLGILELHQVELDRLLEEELAHPMRQAHPQEGLRGGAPALRREEEDGQERLERHQLHHGGLALRPAHVGALKRRHHLVDDEAGDPGDRRREHARGEGGGGEREDEPARRPEGQHQHPARRREPTLARGGCRGGLGCGGHARGVYTNGGRVTTILRRGRSRSGALGPPRRIYRCVATWRVVARCV